jgi:hypothetical protein
MPLNNLYREIFENELSPTYSELFSRTNIDNSNDLTLFNLQVVQTGSPSHNRSTYPAIIRVKFLPSAIQFDEQYLMLSMTQFIIQATIGEIKRRVQYFRNLSDSMILNLVEGKIFLYDTESSKNCVYNSYKKLNEITAQDYLEILSIIKQSDDNTLLTNLEFGIILNINSLQRGSGGQLKKKINKEGLNDIYNKSGYCLGIALFCGKYEPDKRDYRVQINHERIFNESVFFETAKLNLIDPCEMSECSSIEEINKFINLNPGYRVIIVYPFTRMIMRENIFQGPDWKPFESNENEFDYSYRTIFIYYDNNHFQHIKFPNKHFRLNGKQTLCYKCLYLYKTNHECSTRKRKIKIINKNCSNCGAIQGRNHECYFKYCNDCREMIDETVYSYHRCFIDGPLFTNSESIRGVLPEVWAWDLESMFVTSNYEIRNSYNEFNLESIAGFNCTGERVYYTMEKVQEHVPNCIKCLNIRTGEWKTFNDLVTMINFFIRRSKSKIENEEEKDVKIYMFAHNSSGYDTRLLYQKCRHLKPNNCIFRGSKILRIEYQNVIFLDSMLHFAGSLKAAGDFIGRNDEEKRKTMLSKYRYLLKDGEPELCKGYFPYLFNTVENQEYKGIIPEKIYFNINKTAKNQIEYNKFCEWHDLQIGEYDFKQQLNDYCEQDVRLLAMALLSYEECHLSVTSISPLRYTTAATVSQTMYFASFLPTTQLAILRKEEHCFARKALRGGRTDVKKLHHIVGPNEKIVYRDVCSLYPYCQISQIFPTGIPHIYANVDVPLHEMNLTEDRKLFITFQEFDTKFVMERILCNEIFGYIMIDGYYTKKDIIHPPLPTYKAGHVYEIAIEEPINKCLFSLTDVKKQVFTTIEVAEAIKVGFVITFVYRIDVYQKSCSLWKKFFENYQKLKILTKPPKTINEKERLIFEYKKRFNIDLDINEFEDNPAKQKTFKITLNSLWGKFAQNAVQEINEHINPLSVDGAKQYNELINRDIKGEITMKVPYFTNDNEDVLVIPYIDNENDPNYVPNLTKMNVAAAGFVPAYGRIMLYKELQKLGTRVLMHDTDSFIATCKIDNLGNELEYLPPQGNILGDWEAEDYEKGGGIIEWLGLGPKSYALKYIDEKNTIKTIIKCKGIPNNLETQKEFHYENFRKLILGEIDNISVQTFKFEWSPKVDHNMYTRYMAKVISRLKDSQRKGIIIDNYIFPFGYIK